MMQASKLNLTTQQQILIGCGLALLMALTRGLPIPGFELLPGASWAVFLLAGFYLRSILALPALLALAVLIDGIAVGWAGVAAYCLTPVYAMLAPAYAALWLAGRWFAGHYEWAWRDLPRLAVAVFAGAAVCELISSGSFYWLSGQFETANLVEFQARELVYFPAYLAAMTFWVGFAIFLHVAWQLSGSYHASVQPSV